MISRFLPLVSKELEEQASRPRTYATRAVFIVVLFGTFGTIFVSTVGTAVDPLLVLGKGGRLYESLITLLVAYVTIVVPIFVSGVISAERSTGSLELLRMTTLGPTAIVVQKFIGRMIPVLCNLLVAVPVLLLTYAFGGVELEALARAAAVLVATALLFSAVALDMSCAARSTESAVGLTGIVIVVLTLCAVAIQTTLATPGCWLGQALCPPLTIGFGPAGATPMSVVLGQLGIVSATTLIFLVDAARRLTAGVEMSERADERTARTGSPNSSRNRLPTGRPIAWRQRHRSTLAKPQTIAVGALAGALVSLAFVVVVARSTGVALSHAMFVRRGTVSILAAWWVGGLLVSTAATVMSITSERTQKTFEVLMTTPLSGAEILLDKLIAVRRLRTGLCVLALGLVAYCWRAGYFSREEAVRIGIAFTAGSMVQGALFGWLAVTIGLRTKDPHRATVTVLSLLVLVSLLPVIGRANIAISGLLSPLALAMRELEPVWSGAKVPSNDFPLIAVAILHGGASLWLRQVCLRNADRFLGRAEYDWWSRQRFNSPFR
ncbi:MAG: ABC transporter permease [Planctomycetes bacterium]|nr:ABC transporter permease [Planctomycetota bacterium]